MSFKKINVSEQIKEKCKNDSEFNQLWMENKEYEMLRWSIITEGGEDNIVEGLKSFNEELLNDEEYMKWACKLTTDVFGSQHLNGIMTVYLMLISFGKINQNIANELLDKLLFEYQDEEETYPLILTGERVLGKYLHWVLTNPDIQLNEKRQQRITECVIQDATTVADGKNIDGSGVMTLLLRTDIQTNLKKTVIDTLPDTFLYILKDCLEKLKLDVLLSTFSDFDSIDSEFDVENLDSNAEAAEDVIDTVVELIDDKLYS